MTIDEAKRIAAETGLDVSGTTVVSPDGSTNMLYPTVMVGSGHDAKKAIKDFLRLADGKKLRKEKGYGGALNIVAPIGKEEVTIYGAGQCKQVGTKKEVKRVCVQDAKYEEREVDVPIFECHSALENSDEVSG